MLSSVCRPSSGGQRLISQPLTRRSRRQSFSVHANRTLRFSSRRFLSDTIAEWKTDSVTTAFEYHVGTEQVAVPGNPRAL